MATTETLARITDLIDDGVIVTDPAPLDGEGPTIRYANPAFLRLSGFADGEVVGRTLAALNAAASDGADMAAVLAANATTRTEPADVTFRHRDGSVVRVAVTVHPLPDPGGLTMAFACVLHDRTAEAAAEEQLADRERKLEEAERIAGLAWWEYTPATDTMAWTAPAASLLGLPPAARAPSRREFLERFVHPQDRAQVALAFGTELPRRAIEYRAVRADGSLRMIHTETTCEADAAGGPTRIFAVSRDVTTRWHATEALRDAKEQAEEANRAKSRFLASASHDLRQPLNAMSLLLGVLRNRSIDRGLLAIVDQLQHSLDAMMELFNALLDISNFETGGVQVNHAGLALDHLFNRLHVDFAGPARAKGLELRIVGSRRRVWSDAMLLERVLRNLVANAIRYTPHGGRVLIGARHRGGNLRIDVIDTGPGIPADQLRSIFDEFHQVGNPARRRGEGHGLGLAIVKRAADLMGHVLDVRSVPGRGSRFSVEVPLDPDGQGTRAVPALADAARAPRGCRVLVVEDDPLVAMAMRLVLQDLDCDVLLADSASEAEAAIRAAGAVDLILADFRLPGGVDGIETVGRVRVIVGAEVLAGIITGDLSTEVEARATAAGARCLIKPVRPADLAALVDAACRS